MNSILQCVSPVDGQIYVERPLADDADISAALDKANQAQCRWRQASLAQRQQYVQGFLQAFSADKDAIAEELSWQMGRPIAYSPGEVGGVLERGQHMLDIAESALADVAGTTTTDTQAFIRREPIGTVLVIAAWNYPYLIAVNSVIPALLAGNAVILKPSAQTPLCGERFAAAFAQAGLPDGLFQVLHCDHANTSRMVQDQRIGYVSFTGSVAGGQAIQEAAHRRFIGVGLELGGKDAAYVRADADVDAAVANLVDGAFFNSGQSCCGIERIYVHHHCYARFVEQFVATTRQYQLGNPLDSATTLGPMVRTNAASHVREQIQQAVALGGQTLINPADFAADANDSPYMAPQVMVEVDHSMSLMREESFGPVVGIMSVHDDEQAIALVNDSRYGLTASVWTQDLQHAEQLAGQIQAGTVFANRCDYLDPSLAWTGVKDSGHGSSLSALGYAQLTQPKSYHFRQP